MKLALLVTPEHKVRQTFADELLRSGWQVIAVNSLNEVDVTRQEPAVDVAVIDTRVAKNEVSDVAKLHANAPGMMLVHWDPLVEEAVVLPDRSRLLPLHASRAGGISTTLGQWWESHTYEVSTADEVANSVSMFAAELERARRDFIEGMPQKLDDLAAAARQAVSSDGDSELARSLAHKLRGSAGSYGLVEVGQVAGEIEDLVRSVRRDGDLSSPGVAMAIERLLARLFLAFTQGAKTRHVAEETALLAAHPAILVLESDQEFVRNLSRVAQVLRLDVLVAQGPQDALVWAHKRSLAGIVLATVFEDEPLFELAHRLRESPGHEQVPIAFLASEASVEARLQAVQAGAASFLDKPVADHTLMQTLQAFVEANSSRAGHVLIVDDDPDVAAHYTLHLRAAGIGVDNHSSAHELVEKLDKTNPDVVLLDIDLPGVSGLEFCRALRMSSRWQLLPVLIVSARIDDHTRLQAFRAGASDVISKPVLPEELRARVAVQLERVRLVRERSEKDALSGLLLRRSFVEGAERMLARCARQWSPLTIVLFDLDHFKQINDTYGHLAGDEVIRRFGELLRRRFRLDDLRGRWGGEEFILAFAAQSATFGEKAAVQLLQELGRLRFVADNGKVFSATFTAGVSTFPDDGHTLTDLIRVADQRLYAGKRMGRARVCVDQT